MGAGRGWVRVARDALLDVARAVLPVECPGCGRPDVRFCESCGGLVAGPLRRCETAAPRLDRLDGAPPLPVWSLAPYVGGVRDLVVAWKDRGRADLDRPLHDAVRRAGRTLAPGVGAVVTHAGAGVLDVVPVPSSAAARRSRGREPVRGLAEQVAAGLVAGGARARCAPLLVQRGRVRDQVGLGARERAGNLAGGIRARGAAAGRPGVPCLLVDDVLTTGATLAACEDALAGAGRPVLGALVLAATPAPGAHSVLAETDLRADVPKRFPER